MKKKQRRADEKEITKQLEHRISYESITRTS
jgi:hypothetical protein